MENSLFFFYIIVTNTFVFCDESTFVCINVHVINFQKLISKVLWKMQSNYAPVQKFGINLKLEHTFALLSQRFFFLR